MSAIRNRQMPWSPSLVELTQAAQSVFEEGKS